MTKEGKIIIGYQGIGKSTLTLNNDKVIDLESSNFFVDGKRPDYWFVIYCKIAKDLCKQGYTVCMSSHKEVRNYLSPSYGKDSLFSENVYVVYPSLELKDKWINKLKYRYEQTESIKDFKALKGAENFYEENITDLMNEKEFKHIVIEDMNYDLAKLLL